MKYARVVDPRQCFHNVGGEHSHSLGRERALGKNCAQRRRFNYSTYHHRTGVDLVEGEDSSNSPVIDTRNPVDINLQLAHGNRVVRNAGHQPFEPIQLRPVAAARSQHRSTARTPQEGRRPYRLETGHRSASSDLDIDRIPNHCPSMPVIGRM